MEKIAATPHCGADTFEAQDRVGVTIANQVLAALRGELVPNAVNLPTLQEEELESLYPYLCLVEKMGKIYFQLDKNPVERVEITYSGRVANMDSQMLTVSFLKGLLEPIIGEKVNYVNASLITENRGVKVVTTREESNDRGFVDLIYARVYGSTTFMEVSGTLTAKREPKIVSVKGYDTDITPTENMLFVENIDRPGVIGPFANVLGEHQINIAMMGVGRQLRGDLALMTLNVDSEVDEIVVNKLRELDGIKSVKVVKF
jgi:D-3-phosphoglycerate dehydrogenase